MSIIKGKSKRTAVFTVVSAVIIIAVLILNFLLASALAAGAYYGDMTPEGFYTLTDAMIEECSFLASENFKDEKGNTREVKITFCNDPDYLISSIETRYVYFMALDLAKVYPNVKVETVNVTMNPTAVAEYKATSLTSILPSDVIVSEGNRYRIANVQRFWIEGNSYENDLFFNGEYRLATLIKSVTVMDKPKAYFVTDHGETYYDKDNPESEMSIKMSELYDLLVGRGLAVETLELSDPEVERVPDDCALLIINNPTEDFTYDENRLDELSYVSDTEKLDIYLTMNQGAIMIAKDYEVTLPVFEEFLYEWGFDFSKSKLKDEKNEISSSDGQNNLIIAEYSTDTDSYGYAIYGEYADLSSAPVTVFGDTGAISCSFRESKTVNEPGAENITRNYVSFLTTGSESKLYNKNAQSGEYVDLAGDVAVRDLASLSIRSHSDNKSNESFQSYIFCTASADFFERDILGNLSFANYDIVSGVINNISRFDEYADNALGGNTFNSESYGGKRMTATHILSDGLLERDYKIYSNKYDPENPNTLLLIKTLTGLSTASKVIYTVIIAIIPLSILALGIVVHVKRRYK